MFLAVSRSVFRKMSGGLAISILRVGSSADCAPRQAGDDKVIAQSILILANR
jgi:hypothetical protein